MACPGACLHPALCRLFPVSCYAHALGRCVHAGAWHCLSRSPVRLTHSWQAPLDVFLHSQLWLLLSDRLGWTDAIPAYRLLSPLAGALYLLMALALSRDEELAPGWVTYGLLASLGLMQLFFGYVENYSFAAAGVLAYLWLGLRVLRGKTTLWVAAAVLAVTNATHPSTVILAPSLLYLGWHAWRTRNKSALSIVVQIALPMLVVGSVTFGWMEMSGHGVYALFEYRSSGRRRCKLVRSLVGDVDTVGALHHGQLAPPAAIGSTNSCW